jgi:hypothetical protein
MRTESRKRLEAFFLVLATSAAIAAERRFVKLHDFVSQGGSRKIAGSPQ